MGTIDELQAEESKSQLQARRAERDLREEREGRLRLERELEGWKALRVERGVGTDARRVSAMGGGASATGSLSGLKGAGNGAGAGNLDGVSRQMSKGFL